MPDRHPAAWFRQDRRRRAVARSSLPRAHSVSRPTTGSLEHGPNSVELAPQADPGQISRRLDHRHLHAEADAEEGNLALTGEPDRRDLAFGAALAKAARHQDMPFTPSSLPAPHWADSNIWLSTQSSRTRTRCAMPPWISASASDL